jgi:opacity protein-like surface antigen
MLNLKIIKMKKIIVVIAVGLLFGFAAKSQTQAGKIIVGGASAFDLSFFTTKDKPDQGTSAPDTKNTSFNLQPEVGYFVIDNLAVGAMLNAGYSHSKQEANSRTFENNSSQFLVGPFAKYYVGSSNLKPFIEADILFGSGKNVLKETGNDDTTTKTSIFGFAVGAGAAYFITDNVSLDFGLAYMNLTDKNKDTKDKTTNGGISIQAGFNFLF